MKSYETQAREVAKAFGVYITVQHVDASLGYPFSVRLDSYEAHLANRENGFVDHCIYVDQTTYLDDRGRLMWRTKPWVWKTVLETLHKLKPCPKDLCTCWLTHPYRKESQ